MKRLIFTLSLLAAVVIKSSAQATDTWQYCGPSGPNACTVVQLSAPGLAPVSDSLAPIIDGTVVNTTINFQNYDTLTFSGIPITMDSLTIDTIANLPAGLCWKTSSPTNTFPNQGNGCITVTGTTNALPGQYQLIIYVSAYTTISQAPNPLNTYANATGLYYYVRVNCSDSAAVVPVDTNGQDEGTLPKFVAYPQQAHCNTAIKTVDANIQTLTVYPNPFTNQAVVSFTSLKEGSMTEKITNILGSEVYSNQFDVVAGQNSHSINRKNLAAGVYFYTITDGSVQTTTRLVVTE